MGILWEVGHSFAELILLFIYGIILIRHPPPTPGILNPVGSTSLVTSLARNVFRLHYVQSSDIP